MKRVAQGKGSKPGKGRRRRFNFGKLLVLCGIAGALAIVCATIGYMIIIYNGQDLYKKYSDEKMVMSEASTVYDANDKEVTILYREHRELVTPQEIPPLVKNAFIATEDRRFDQHQGVDLWAIGRAVVKDIIARSAVEGGSTITQQLAKNMFLNSDKTFFRKATEVSIALALEENHSKEEILTMYLNRIYFGNGAYGIKAAAKKYFGVSDLKDLKLWQAATLAGIPKSPKYYSPILFPERSKDRRAVVLKLMFDQGYITEEEKTQANNVEYTPPAGTDKKFLTYMDYVLDEAEEVYKLEEDKLLRGGYKIKTAMDPNAQLIMEKAFQNPKLFQKDGPQQKMQGSMVILNHKDGGIVAMIGGREYVEKGLNRATVRRQPGSAFKPVVVYAPAIENKDMNPYTKLEDNERSYGNYSPRNYDGVYKGQVDMFEAVRRSTNAPAVWLLNEMGVKTGISFAEKLGITFDKQDNNLAIALGGMTKGVTPLELAGAYSAFANGGYLHKTHAIRSIEDKDGTKIAEFKPSKSKVMSPKASYYMTELLKGVVEGGTGQAAKMNRPVAGKTGTTQLDLKGLEKFNRDIWFAGYTPEWTAAVWMGFDKTDSKHYIGAQTSFAAAMFKEVMQNALAKVPVTPFVKPEGVPDLKAPPKAVTNLTGEYVKEKGKVRLTWTAEDADSIGSYQLYQKEAKEADFILVATTPKGVNEFNDMSVKPGGTYQYYLVPYNEQSNVTGERSNVVEVAVPADDPGGLLSPLPSLLPGASPGASGKPQPSGSPAPGGSPGKSPAPGGSPSPTATPKPSQEPGQGKPQPSASAEPAGNNGGQPLEVILPNKSSKPGNN